MYEAVLEDHFQEFNRQALGGALGGGPGAGDIASLREPAL